MSYVIISKLSESFKFVKNITKYICYFILFVFIGIISQVVLFTLYYEQNDLLRTCTHTFIDEVEKKINKPMEVFYFDMLYLDYTSNFFKKWPKTSYDCFYDDKLWRGLLSALLPFHDTKNENLRQGNIDYMPVKLSKLQCKYCLHNDTIEFVPLLNFTRPVEAVCFLEIVIICTFGPMIILFFLYIFAYFCIENDRPRKKMIKIS